MNRAFISAAVVLAVVVGVMLNMQQVLSAEQAVVQKGSGVPCALFGADANGEAVLQEGGEITMTVENDNKVMMRCKGTGITNLSGSEQNFDGFPCGVLVGEDFVLTEDSHATVSETGVATMTCTVYK